MTFFFRAKYAFFVTVLVVGVLSVIAMIFSLDVGGRIFSGSFGVPAFIVSFLLAPLLEKFIKLK